MTTGALKTTTPRTLSQTRQIAASLLEAVAELEEETFSPAIEDLERALDAHAFDDAVRHFEGPGACGVLGEAAEANRCYKLGLARGCLRQLAERLLQSVDPMAPVAAPPEPNLFRRDGHYWTLGYRGQVVRLKDSKGLRDIARLLASPGNEVHVAELASEANGVHSTPPYAIADERLTSAGIEALGAGREPALDARARQAYRARVVELRAEVEDGERCNDRGRAERARAELEAITAVLASAHGLGGRRRAPGSAFERARVAVAMRIRNALAKIDNEHQALGHHLLRSIKTGTFCAYQPEVQVYWQL